MRRVVVTGLGIVSPLGLGVRRSWKRLINGECGIVSVKDRGPQFEQQTCQVAAAVPQGSKEDGGWNASDWLSRDDQRKMAQYAQYAIVAAQEALDDAGWYPKTSYDQEMTGVCIGSGIGSLEDIYDTSLAYDKGGPKKVSPLFVPRLLINLAAGHISMKYGFKGPNHAVTTACTTSAHSIGDASRFIAHSDANLILAGGSESCIHPLALAGFSRSRSLCTTSNAHPHLSSRPFDATRAGFVIGEGAGVLVLEELAHARARGANIYAEVSGYGASADAWHMTAPPADGDGAARAMRRALAHAGVRPGAVDYINAHATGTPLGDAAENRAVRRVMLGEEGKERAGEVNVSSTKGAVGHLLGAAGAVEAVWSVMAIEEGVMPPTVNLRDLDDGFDCNYVPREAQARRVDVVLSNSFGFGGTNASLCFARYTG